MSYYYGFKPYVPVAKRRAQAATFAARLAKQEKRTLAPIQIAGRKIASSRWGQAWCDNLEQYSNFANRLPRGRTYVRNGSVIDLQIESGRVRALVSGSDIYRVTIDIKTLAPAAWKSIRSDCSASIHSLIDLLQGRFDQGVMQRLAQPKGGLFPQPAEIDMDCSCPDWAGMCKHVAAVLYGVGSRLDTAPELLFTLRNVDHLELIAQAAQAENLEHSLAAVGTGELAGSDLGEMFGIELDAEPVPARTRRRGKPPARLPSKPHFPEAAQPKPRSTRGKRLTSRKPAASATAAIVARPKGRAKAKHSRRAAK